MKTLYTKLSTMILLATAIAITGCATFEKHASGIELAVTYATMKTVELSSKDTAKRVEVAVRIKSVASDAKSFLAIEAVTLTELESKVRERISRDWSPADQFLADKLIKTLVEVVAERVSEGVLNPNDKVRVNQVLDWVIQGATLSGA